MTRSTRGRGYPQGRKKRGDAACWNTPTLRPRQRRQDGRLELPQARLTEALGNLPEQQREALKAAAERVRTYHESS